MVTVTDLLQMLGESCNFQLHFWCYIAVAITTDQTLFLPHIIILTYTDSSALFFLKCKENEKLRNDCQGIKKKGGTKKKSGKPLIFCCCFLSNNMNAYQYYLFSLCIESNQLDKYSTETIQKSQNEMRWRIKIERRENFKSAIRNIGGLRKFLHY